MVGSVGGKLQWAGRLGPNRVAAVLAVPFLYVRIRTFTAPLTPSSALAEGQLANADQNGSANIGLSGPALITSRFVRWDRCTHASGPSRKRSSPWRRRRRRPDVAGCARAREVVSTTDQ